MSEGDCDADDDEGVGNDGAYNDDGDKCDDSYDNDDEGGGVGD